MKGSVHKQYLIKLLKPCPHSINQTVAFTVFWPFVYKQEVLGHWKHICYKAAAKW